MRNKRATGRAYRGTRITHRGVNYRIVGTGIFAGIVRESDGKGVASVQSFYETPREAIDRALLGIRFPRDHAAKWPKSRQHNRILSMGALGRQRLTGRVS